MKRAILIGIAVCAGAALLQAATNVVTSVNSVGFIKLSFDRGSRYLCAINLQRLDGNQAISNLLDAAQLPNSTQLFTWDTAGQKYAPVCSIAAGKWVPGSNQIERGESFWIKIPAGAPQTNYVVTIYGEVPTNATEPLLVVPQMNFLGYPFPAGMALTSSALTKIAKNSDQLYYWRNNAWQIESFAAGRFVPGNYVFTYGDGILYKSTASTNKVWTEIKPYLWP